MVDINCMGIHHSALHIVVDGYRIGIAIADLQNMEELE